MNGRFTDIIEAPVITEKGTVMRQEGNWYLFKVSRNANKIELKRAVEKLFGVHVLEVRTMRVKGKKKHYGNHDYRTAEWKKAMVRLKEGETIEVFEGV